MLRMAYFSRLRLLSHFVWGRVREIEIFEVSSSMTLATLLSVVPVLALSVAVFTAFPAFAAQRQQLQDVILKSFLPSQYSEALVQYIGQFASHAAGLTIFGLAGLLLTALLLVDKLFVTVNSLFKANASRPWAQRILIYWALITLGPLCMAGSAALMAQAVSSAVSIGGVTAHLLPWVYGLLQVLLQAVGFALLYKYVPFCQVRWRDALVGGLSAALCGVMVRTCFAVYVNFGTLGAIYGVFAVLPVLIIWIYLAWILFFAGAALTATLPMLSSSRYMDLYLPGNEFLSGIVMLCALVRRSMRGEPAVLSTRQLCKEADLYPQAADAVLMSLSQSGYVRPTESPDGIRSWVLIADPRKDTLQNAFTALCISSTNTLLDQAGSGKALEWWRALMRSDSLRLPLFEALFPHDKDPFNGKDSKVGVK